MRKKLSSITLALVSLVIPLIPLAAWADAEPQPVRGVPEPTSWLLFGMGALGVGWAIRRRRRG